MTERGSSCEHAARSEGRSRMSTRARRSWLYAGAAALLAAITWIDYVTGYEFGFFIFYFVPVALAAWYGSRGAGIARRSICTGL